MKENWKEEYWDLIISGKEEAGITLKSLNLPDSLYKYRQLSEKSLNSISENYIWLAEIASLNDPFESSLQFDNDKCERMFFGSEKFRVSFKHKSGQQKNNAEINSIITRGKERVRKEVKFVLFI